MERIAELRLLLADGTITAAELAELRTLIVDRATELADVEADETVAAEMTDLADTLDKVSELEAAAAAEAEANATKAAEALARIRGSQTTTDDGGEGGDEVETVDTAEGDDDGATADGERETVNASGTKPPARRPVTPPPAVSRVAARRPPEMKALPLVAPPARMSLVAAANVPGFTSRESLDDPEKFATAFAAAVGASNGYRGPRVQIPVATTSVEYPDAEQLDGDMRGNARKIQARTSLAAMRAYADSNPDLVSQGLIASGGACAPSTVLYDLPTLGTAARPVRDTMLVRFGADRGGVRVMPPPHIEDLDAAINVWTAATDAAPGGNTKGCLTVTCPSPAETLVDAIVRCLKFGNFQARFFAEQTEAWLNLAAAQWAREAENKMLTAMGTGSTNVLTGQLLGTTRDVLAALDRACAGIRSANRLPRDFPLRFGFPGWLYDNMRTDLARELPGATAERLATADAELNRFFAVRNVNVSPFLDGETGQVFARQGTGPLIGWPSTVITYLYPEGSWLFLDGGSLDLGVVRDSTLNAKNDFQMFAETFENVVFHGVTSYRLNIDICPDGQTSAAATIAPCTTGS